MPVDSVEVNQDLFFLSRTRRLSNDMNFVLFSVDGCPTSHGDCSRDCHWFGEGERCRVNYIANNVNLIRRRNEDDIAWPHVWVGLLLTSNRVFEVVIVNLVS